MKNIAIIPARGGSKRIPKKNIRNFLGKSVIAYSIEAAINSKCFDEVMVSTDNAEIAGISKKYGAKIPFYRSEENSDDFATTSDVLLEVITSYKSIGIEFDYGCCIYPAAPFVTPEIIRGSFKKFIDIDAYSLIPVVKFGYPIQRAFKKEGDYIKMFHQEYIDTRSQDLESSYHDAGQFCWFQVEEFLNGKNLITDKTAFYEISEFNSQDIDNEEDWKMAELKYNLIFGNQKKL
jgi:pseudaminic acid cytidylyltransferase